MPAYNRAAFEVPCYIRQVCKGLQNCPIYHCHRPSVFPPRISDDSLLIYFGITVCKGNAQQNFAGQDASAEATAFYAFPVTTDLLLAFIQHPKSQHQFYPCTLEGEGILFVGLSFHPLWWLLVVLEMLVSWVWWKKKLLHDNILALTLKTMRIRVAE